MLVIDVMVYVGCDLNELVFFDIIIICYGGKFIMLDGILVGLCLDMYQVVLNIYCDFGFSLVVCS